MHSSEVSNRLVGPLPAPTPGVGFQKQPYPRGSLRFVFQVALLSEFLRRGS